MYKGIERTLSECFHSKEGKPNLRKIPVNTERARQHIDKAQEERVVEQYGVEIFTNDDAEWIIEDAKDFVLKIEEVLAE